MPGDENVLFGAEWDNEGMREGVNELVAKLAEAKDAESKLKVEIKETNVALAANTKELALNKAALAKATDPADIKRFNDNIVTLTKNEQILNKNLHDQQTELIVVSKGVGLYNSEVNKLVKNQSLVANQVEKFTSINHLASEGLGLFRRQVVDSAFALVSGFAGGLIATVLPSVVEFVEGLVGAGQEMSEFQRRQADINLAIDESGKQYEKAVENVSQLRINIQLAKEGFIDKNKVVKEYNETIGKTTGQVKSLDEAEQELNKNADAYIKFTLFKAAANVALGEAAKKAFEIEQDRFKRDPTQNIDIRRDAFANATKEQIEQFNKLGRDFDEAFLAHNKARADSLKAQQKEMFNTFAEGNVDKKLKDEQKTFLDIAESFQRDAAKISKDFHFDFFGGEFDTKDTKAVENVFQQKLKELQARLAELTAKSFQSEGTIRKQFAASLEKEIEGIGELEKAKKLQGNSGVPGKSQAEVLIEIVGEINTVQLQKSLDDFNKARLEAQKKINDVLQQAEHDASLKRIENIRDEFERERQLIDEKAAGINDALLKKRDQLIKDLDKTDLTDEQKKGKRFLITAVFSELLDENETARINQQINNAFKSFQNSLKEGNVLFEKLLLENDEKTARSIGDSKKLYEAGAITYEEFQKRVTKALKDQKAERDRIRILELTTDLAAIQQRLTTETDADNRKTLEEQARKIREQIAAIQISVGKGDDDGTKKRTDQLQKYVQSLGSLLNQIASFWNQVNATEAAALDRSISLQERRVENARDIADKGNAEYLEMEQKRLDELQAKREANAQKQLAINNALVLSQALLAAVSAIASAAQAPAGSGPFLAIAAGIAVLGAIAAAFSFVDSLQPPVATFFKGKEYVQQGNNPAGIDTVPARVTIGERIVTVQENKDYYPALTAIHNRKVSPEVMNSFVENYINKGGESNVNSFVENYSTPIPVVNYDRLSQATGQQEQPENLEVQKKLDNLDTTMNKVVDAIKQISFSSKLDENGLEVGIRRVAEKRRLRHRS